MCPFVCFLFGNHQSLEYATALSFPCGNHTQTTHESEDLADAYLDAHVIPAKKRDDARHVAIATVAGLEIVVSWNHRHLANERKRDLFYAVNRLGGYEQQLFIHTPFEVMQ